MRLSDLVPTLGGAAGSATSAVASICCIGPLAITLLGVHGAIWAAGVKPYRPYLLVLSVALLAWAHVSSRRMSAEGATCSRRVHTWSKVILWGATATWVGALTIQYFADRYWL